MDDIREGVEYYIDSNQEADFYEDEELYEDLVGSRDLLSPRNSQDELSGEEEGDLVHAEGAAATDEKPATDSQPPESDRQLPPTPTETPPTTTTTISAPGHGTAPTTHASMRSSQVDLKNYSSAPSEPAPGENFSQFLSLNCLFIRFTVFYFISCFLPFPRSLLWVLSFVSFLLFLVASISFFSSFFI